MEDLGLVGGGPSTTTECLVVYYPTRFSRFSVENPTKIRAGRSNEVVRAPDTPEYVD